MAITIAAVPTGIAARVFWGISFRPERNIPGSEGMRLKNFLVKAATVL
jgi:hypothetical protein